MKRFCWIFPLLLLANLLGFAYAYLGQIYYLKRSPFLTSTSDLPPFGAAYWQYLQGIASGQPATFNAPVSVTSIQLPQAALASFALVAGVIALSVPFGIWLGRRSVHLQTRQVSPPLLWATTLAMAAPSFFFGALVSLAWLFLPGSIRPTTNLWILPLLVLTIRPTFQIARFTAILLQGELGKAYILTGRGFGQTWQRIRNRTAFANILAPLVGAIAAALRLLLAEIILVERLFNYPGIGRLFALAVVTAHSTATRAAPVFLHPPLVAGLVTIFALAYFIITWVAESASQMADVRLKAGVE